MFHEGNMTGAKEYLLETESNLWPKTSEKEEP